MVKIKKTAKEDQYYHVRFRQPSQFSSIRTPDWAANIASSISKDAEVRMGKTKQGGNWLVQTVLIKRAPGKTYNDARRLARRIQKKVDS